jgi:hypothetical protein
MTFTFHAFHPKAECCLVIRQVFWLETLLNLPILLIQNSGKFSTILLFKASLMEVWRVSYSYGDSTGFTPDFPFNPAHTGTKSLQM